MYVVEKKEKNMSSRVRFKPLLSAVLAMSLLMGPTALAADNDSAFPGVSGQKVVENSKDEGKGIFEILEEEDLSVADFVERLYTIALNRASEKEGKEFWVKELEEGKRDGAECARFFLLDAPEFMNRNLSVEDFVETLYRTFFDRESEADGKVFWVESIKNGTKTRVDVVNGFIDSKEWCDVCASYGIRSGAPTAKATRPSKNALNFATRLYTCCLGREPEEEGLAYWSLALTNLEQTGSNAAQLFFELPEFIGFRTSDEEYLKRLYTTFMDREPEKGGLEYWLGELAKGKSRRAVMAGFADSPEFTDICKKYGIERGSINMDAPEPTPPPPATPTPEPTKGILDWEFYTNFYGDPIDPDNEIRELIAEKTGIRVTEKYMNQGMSGSQAIAEMVKEEKLPEFIDGGDYSMDLYSQGVLVAWDPYLAKPEYANLKAMYSDDEWDMFRQDDGKIYWANVFNNSWNNKPIQRGYNDQAFWIQVRVLEWAGYPIVETLDEYLELLEKYAKANPYNQDGTKVIPYTALCEDWRYFCLENAPIELDGFANDGSVIVNEKDFDKPTIVDPNTTATAKKYFQKLNTLYNKGMMDKDFAIQTYDEYLAKLSSGAVLGMNDQWWDFAGTVNDNFAAQGFDELGYNYVPLGLTIEKGMTNHWCLPAQDEINTYSGIAVTTSCEDPDRAFAFLNSMLDQDIHDLRFWGIEGVDYKVDENGTKYRTKEMIEAWDDSDYLKKHACKYEYFPQYGGYSRDGKSTMKPEDSESVFFGTMPDPLRKCFEAYGYKSYCDFLRSDMDYETGPWFPMYSISNSLMTDTDAGVAWCKMGEAKHTWLPQVVIDKDFDATWDKYMEAYKACKPSDFLNFMQEKLDEIVKKAG